ncbi:MAG: hypothetical protein KDI79_08690 [Anaerolineae bacterium]|nr:hypothetical protein [Anaerolineae bacterium]
MAINTKDILGKITSKLSWRSRRLLSLADVIGNDSVKNALYLGTHPVSLDQIRGSASPGKCKDFDSNFQLVNGHNSKRWAGIYQARTSGRGLPPVTLIRVGEVYFVEDGHHRISVAWALGDAEIEGHITIWELSKPQPGV